jgi:hypothetical protein
MQWVIWSASQKKYVNWPGRQASFVPRMVDARRFPTKEAAEAECCGDEYPKELSV